MAIHYQTALEMAEQIHRREISSVDATRQMLERIGNLNPGLNAFVTVCADEAIKAAELSDAVIEKSGPRSPLDGVPIAVKDLLDTAGVETTYGMKIYRGHVPDEDATVVARLKAAGAVILGKLALTEGAYARHHPEFDVPVNPWNSDCWTGVSSSGSGVATSAGLCFASIGSDTGGSIRFPSASNGIVGLKPTWGRVSRAGAFPLAYTLDHIGPMTRSVRDAAAMLGVIAGEDQRDPTSSRLPVADYLGATDGEIDGLVVGVDWRDCEEGADEELVSALGDAVDCLREAGIRVRDISIPYERMARAWPVTCAIEAAHAHEATYPARRGDYGPIADLLELGRSLPASVYLEQEVARRGFKATLDGVFQDVDLIICPSMAYAALPREGSKEADEAEQDLGRTLRYTAPFDYSGSPTLSIPWEIGSKGVPLSVQLVARDFEEPLLIRAGAVLERLGGHGDNHPEVD